MLYNGEYVGMSTMFVLKSTATADADSVVHVRFQSHAERPVTATLNFDKSSKSLHLTIEHLNAFGLDGDNLPMHVDVTLDDTTLFSHHVDYHIGARTNRAIATKNHHSPTQGKECHFDGKLAAMQTMGTTDRRKGD